MGESINFTIAHHKFDSIHNTLTIKKYINPFESPLHQSKNQKNCSHEPRALEAVPYAGGRAPRRTMLAAAPRAAPGRQMLHLQFCTQEKRREMRR
jgi:hypothetical protein